MILASRFGLQHIVTRNVVTATQRSADTTTRPYEDIPAPPGVNFNNILLAAYLYESVLHSFRFLNSKKCI